MKEEETGRGETEQDADKVAKDDVELFSPVVVKCPILQENKTTKSIQ